MIRKGLVWSIVPILAVFGFAAYGWFSTETGQQVPVHWGVDGQPDRYGSRMEAFAIMPLMSLGLTALLAVVPMIDPRGRNLRNSGAFYLTAWIGVLLVMAGAQAMVSLTATGVLAEDVVGATGGRFIFAGVAALFLFLGNVMGKARPNWFAGVRTPWTLSSDLSWERTHRVMGRIWVVMGAVGVLAAIFAPMAYVAIGFLVGVLGSVVFAVIYSYVVWKNDPVRETAAAAEGGS